MTTSTTSPGSLSRNEQFRFARHAVGAQLKSLPGSVRARLGRGASSALAREQAPPDSALSLAAAGFVAEHYSTSLYHHCLRCWYFGDFFAQIGGYRYDPELLYVSCLFHDIALTSKYRDQRTYACFAAEGGALAKSWLEAQGTSPGYGDTVANVIARHMDVSVSAGVAGNEPYLLHEAAHLDVAGARVDEIPASFARQVASRHPREGFSSTFIDAMRHEATQRKSSRASVLWKIGMRLPIATNPLDTAGRQ
ncbi:putative metal dependent phosphohydrolase [Mycobacteroides stephanolepidis]|uniref:Putative metal dependent phosphohydrolase n=1 Tax=[Mycobacterium] stephanolepidis TaxID=1520670 RepID=A0A1Z4EXV9_9MYCO|nr:HD domain-containing protein [[Mycobacterium] stephanolepidis]BAX97810.1 putative metal dependent phosphohydrolase [[Mycobacterium] stephanolepidis]